jgi:hypothetical protein
MNKYFVVVAVCAMAGLSMASTASLAQQKTAKACVEEWRANKAANKAAKITEKAYVAQCRTGAAVVRDGAGAGFAGAAVGLGSEVGAGAAAPVRH